MYTSTRLIAAICLVLAAAQTVAQAQTTWYVDDDAPSDPGPGDPTVSDPNEDGGIAHPFDAIQEAVDAAVSGDEIVVRDGVYTGGGNRAIRFFGKDINLRSESGAQGCLIDAEAIDRAFYLHDGETPAARIAGFTIRNGRSNYGGAIRCWVCSPTIENCVFECNQAYSVGQWDGDGGGFYSEGGAPTIRNCVFRNNDAWTGGAIAAESSGPVIDRCTVVDNTAIAGAGAYLVWTEADVSNTVFARNDSDFFAAVAAGGGSARFRNCTIASNVGHAGVGLYLEEESATVDGCIVWGTDPDEGVQIGVQGDPVALISFCNVQGGLPDGVIDGGGNIDANPLFANLNAGDFHLTVDSPCIDAGDPNFAVLPGATDIDGQPRVLDGDEDGVARVDMGADELLESCVADIDNSGDVALGDLAMLLSEYGGACDGCPEDLNNDTQIDSIDLLILLSVFGDSCR